MMQSVTASAGIAAIQATNRIRLLKSSPIRGAFMTCTVMYGNGVRIGMGITPLDLLRIPKDPHQA